MPLTWDLTNCEDVEFIKADPEWGITHTLILTSINIGIGDWTEKLAAEIYARVHWLESFYGQLLLATENGKRIDRPITPLDIHRRIGLRTNVAFESQASFLRRHAKGAMQSAIYDYNRAARAGFNADAKV